MTHPDLHRTVMYNGMICRIIGVKYGSDRVLYSVLPVASKGLRDAIHDITVDKLAFEPPVTLGGASARDDERREHFLASTAGSNPAAPATLVVNNRGECWRLWKLSYSTSSKRLNQHKAAPQAISRTR